jgi:hypothetical protein
VRAKQCSNHSGENAHSKDRFSISRPLSGGVSLACLQLWPSPSLFSVSGWRLSFFREGREAVGRLRMQWRLFPSASLFCLCCAAHTHHWTRPDGWMDQGGPGFSFRPPDDHLLRLAVAHASSLFPSFIVSVGSYGQRNRCDLKTS